MAVREFDFQPEHFQHVKAYIADVAGIDLAETKKEMVYSRLVRRLRKLNISSFDDYLSYLHREPESEQVHFVNALTTNLTSFFRENHHFEYLASELVPSLKPILGDQETLRVWSAGCSTGEEPYSIAMTLLEASQTVSGLNLSILASDLDTNVIERASQGVYRHEQIDGLSSERKKSWFLKGRNRNEGMVRIKKELQQLIDFRQINLLSDWRHQQLFDLIFCRNVVIYFNKETQRHLFQRLADSLKPNGILIIGHSESLHNISDRFRLIGKTIYQRVG